MADSANRGSQKWLQIAVNQKPELLLHALRESGAIGQETTVTWQSPLKGDPSRPFKEYRDGEALEKAGIKQLKVPLHSFWPRRGPVWDAIGVTSDGPLFIEAKAHIPEAASPATKASSLASRKLIYKSLVKTRHFYAPKATAVWGRVFYQYSNRLAYQYFLKQLNDVPSALVFLYFLNDVDMGGPASKEEWQGASHLIHAVLGIRRDLNLTSHKVFNAFLDIRLLRDVM